MFKNYPGARIRLKAIGGGGGKGQRILGASLLTKKNPSDADIKKAAKVAPELVREVLLEVKANGVGDNKILVGDEAVDGLLVALGDGGLRDLSTFKFGN